MVWMEGVTFGKDGDRTSTAALQNAIAEMRQGLADVAPHVIGCYNKCSVDYMFRGFLFRGLYVPRVNVPQIKCSAGQCSAD